MIPGRDIPPLGSRVGVTRTTRTRVRARAVRAIGDLLARGTRRRVDELRADHGLRPLSGSVNHALGQLPLYLVASLPELDLDRGDLPAGVRYVGPLLWHPPQPPGSEAWLDRVPADRPWVHVTEGTSHFQEPFVLNAAAAGLAGAGYEAILTTGRRRATSSITPGGPNVHVRDWLSHDALLPRCAALVTTGGAGTTMAGLRAGVPLVLVPTSWDKPDIALRMVEAGVAVRLAPRRCTPATLRAAVDEVLRRPALQAQRGAHRGSAGGRARARRRGGCHRGTRGDAAAASPRRGGVRGERPVMSRRGGARAMLATSLSLVAAALVPAAADAAPGPSLPAHAAATAPAPVAELAHGGFGDARNSYSWSMARFKGKLYVGTGREVPCVENFTIDFYLRVSDRYVTDPYPGVRCPADPYDMDLRAEIWEYTPRTGRWRRAYRSPAVIPNPRAKGKFVPADIAFRAMRVFRDGQGRKRLYIGGVTADEYLPELRRRHPPRILSTSDGRHFRATPARNVVVRVPYGDFRPIGLRTMRIWRGRMFVTLTPGLTGDGAIFEVMRPWSPRKARFRQITPKSLAVFETEIFKGRMYAGTGDREKGYGVYRVDGDGPRYRFTPIVTDGAGRGQTATSVVSMHVFDDRLYVGSSGWYNEEEVPVSELIRIAPDGTWQVVAGAPRSVAGEEKAPISGLSDGFYNIFAGHFWRMATYDGMLVVGTNDWSWLVQTAYPGLDQWVIDALEVGLTGELGYDLWASCDGTDWAPITRNAFGSTTGNDFGARNLVTSPAGLYIGSANYVEGTSVRRYSYSGCAPAGRTTASPAAPRRVLTDVQPGGTVLSWRGTAPRGTTYRVLRAGYAHAPVGLMPPQPLAGPWAPDRLPVVTSPATPGAATVDLPVMTALEPIGTTRAPFFVDRTARPGERYAYRVVAVGRSGARSAPSNLQVVPDPRPAPTLAQARRLLGRSALRGRAGPRAAARSATARSATLGTLSRLRRAAPRRSDAHALLERLERRVRYAGAAGLR